ncbi:MAG TPA: glycosyltransferase [Candidatus Paceibacterota bacterium]|nr:glycosyltransferase [Candidatus Paceibacterota bacterium]
MGGRPLRILFVTDLWFTHPNGVATVVSNLKKELEQMGHTVDVFEPSQFFTIPFLPFYPEMRLAIFAGGSIRRKILTGNYDYIHIETEAFLGLYARRTCLKFGIPFTTSLHGQHHLYAQKWVGDFMVSILIRIIVWFHSKAVCTLVSTEVMREELLQFGLKRIFVRPLGVNEMFFGRGTCPSELEKPVFLYMGRVSSEKSIEEFLALDLPGTKLIVGDGPERKKLETLYPSAKFVGYKKNSALVDWCSCADVMVMPSRTETFGLATAECLALGIPVAAHDVIGPREMIRDGVNGYLDEDLSRAAVKCLGLSKEVCRDSVRHFNWRTSAERFLSVLESQGSRIT